MIFVDTHAWYWWLALPERLSARAHDALDAAEAVVVSSMSCYELGLLARRGRIELDRDIEVWLRHALAAEGTIVDQPHPAAAMAAALLGPEFPGDPIDRIIYASARERRTPLVTVDARLRAAAPEHTLW